MEGARVGDVYAVEESEEVEDAEEGDDSEVDFPHQGPFRCMWWTHDIEFIV